MIKRPHLPEVVQGVVGHPEDLVGLAQAVPSPVVPRVDVHRPPVGLNRGLWVLHLDILVPHQSPRGEVVPVQLQRPPEVSHGLLVLGPQGVVVPDDAAGLWLVLVR